MLDVANKYEKELQTLLIDTWYDEKYKFFQGGCYSDLYVMRDTNYNNHQFVSMDKEGNIIGLICYEISRGNEFVDGLSIINFTKNKSLTFGKDVLTVIKNIFEKFNFRKLVFSVVIGNPIEKTYDRLVNKYGGVVIGVYKKHWKLIDNEYYDVKMYEIMREDYLSFKNK